MSTSRNPLPAWQMNLLVGSAALLLVTGLGWLVLHYLLGGALPGLPHPWEATAMKLHGVGVMAGLFILGVLAASHIPKGWRMGALALLAHQRRTGVVLCALAGGLVGTGYALYYLVSEEARPMLGWVHTGFGVAALAFAILHVRRAS